MHTYTHTYTYLCAGLVVDFERLCQEKVREEESVRDQFLMNIGQLQEEIKDLVTMLGEDPPAARVRRYREGMRQRRLGSH